VTSQLEEEGRKNRVVKRVYKTRRYLVDSVGRGSSSTATPSVCRALHLRLERGLLVVAVLLSEGGVRGRHSGLNHVLKKKNELI